MIEFYNLEAAKSAALGLAERRAYPILVHRNYWGHFRIGSRVEKEQRNYGTHILTVHRSGKIEGCTVGISDPIHHPCICLYGEAL